MQKQQNERIDIPRDISGDYQIIALLKQRRYSSLYLAHESGEPEKRVYLEILKGAGEEINGRFHQRIQALSQLSHPGILPIIDKGETTDKHSYAVMPYSPGISLADKLSAWHEFGGSPSVQEALVIIRHLADALTAAHSTGIFHHDLRPDNILITDGNQPVLIDLCQPYLPETASEMEDREPTLVLDYASPEQRQGQPINGRSNIYSLGVILYELLAGDQPKISQPSWDIFQRGTSLKAIPLAEARPGLTTATYELVKKCLWRQEWSRYDTAESLVAAVEAARKAEKQSARQKLVKPFWRRWLFGAVPMGLALVIFSGYFLTSRSRVAANENIPIVKTAVSPTITNPYASQAIPASSANRQVPTPPTNPVILLLAPRPESIYDNESTIAFDWFWPGVLKEDQHFSLWFVGSDEAVRMGSISKPVSKSLFRVTLAPSDLNLSPGSYAWFVTLKTAVSEAPVLKSEQQTFYVSESTPTPAPSMTATDIVVESTATNQPNVDRCIVAPPPNWTLYTIQPGDYLFNLAIQTGTTVARLQEVNCLANSILGVGIRLWLPRTPPTSTPTPQPPSPAAPAQTNSNFRPFPDKNNGIRSRYVHASFM